MAKGRPPKPVELRLIQGNPGKRAIEGENPVVPSSMPDPPAYLSVRALEEWHRLGPLLVDLGLMTNLDRQAFASLCQTTARLEEAEEAMALEGGMMRTSKSKNKYLIQSGYLSIINNCTKQLQTLWSQFGMTPETRAKLRVDAVKPKDAFETYLSRGKSKAPC